MDCTASNRFITKSAHQENHEPNSSVPQSDFSVHSILGVLLAMECSTRDIEAASFTTFEIYGLWPSTYPVLFRLAIKFSQWINEVVRITYCTI